MKVRQDLAYLKEWIDDRLADLTSGKIPDPEKTFVYYWIKNGGGGSDFRNRDVVFESFHNFVALSQWGNTIYNIMLKLEKTTGDPDVKAWFKRTMEGDYDNARGGPFTPLQRFVMELFRVISPNGGSISSLQQLGMREPERHGYAITPHLATSTDPGHWEEPAGLRSPIATRRPRAIRSGGTKPGRSDLRNVRSRKPHSRSRTGGKPT